MVAFGKAVNFRTVTGRHNIGGGGDYEFTAGPL